MKIIFYDGTSLDTSSESSKAEFLTTHRDFIQQLEVLAKNVKQNKELSSRIKRKFKIKNTCGYSLNALIDFMDIFEILQHLMIGSEGTLGFIEEITYYTVEDLPYKASALVFFPTIEIACAAVTQLKLSGVKVDAVELMDRTALRSIEHKQGMPDYLRTFDGNVTALLIETRAGGEELLVKQINSITALLESFPTLRDISFTDKAEEYEVFWTMRKGLFPTVGAIRESGTTVIIEDIAFEIKDLAAGTLRLRDLFIRHGYNHALIFGHALEGNLHFVLTQDFSKPSEIKRYKHFMEDMTQLVAVEFKGSLKAEHGTGRNMTPFVELEWGVEAYTLMKKIKHLFDPYHILNPNVIISDNIGNNDAESYLKNLKRLTVSNPLIDKCMECGFCEPICPSNVLTFTPRHRIVANREISRLYQENQSSTARALEKDYTYQRLDTCAACSLCSSLCPVGVDTGLLTKQLRAIQFTEFDNKKADFVAKHFSTVLKGAEFALKTADIAHRILGTKTMKTLTQGLRSASFNTVPHWSPTLPAPAKCTSVNSLKSQDKVVYFPSCLSRTLGLAKDSTYSQSLYDVTISLLNKANFEVILPENRDNLCCGTPFFSKGFNRQANQKLLELKAVLASCSKNGQYPILCDTSPCVKTLLDHIDGELPIYESIEFTLKFLVERLVFKPIDESIVIHTTCSARKMGLHEKFVQLANLCAKQVIVPSEVSCCGFAGDKGFHFPELNESALRNLKKSIPCDVKQGFSTSKTCEIGLSEHSGIDYHSILYLVDTCTLPRNDSTN